jgi:hypothetical protein
MQVIWQQSHQPLQSEIVAKNYAIASNAVEAQTQPFEPNTIYFHGKPLSLDVVILGVLGTSFFLWAVLYKRMFPAKETDSPHTNSQANLTIQCKNCQFYSPNFYLHCAVHPSRVLKLDAIECPDYCPKSNPSHRGSWQRK